jgi:hypothetical protein
MLAVEAEQRAKFGLAEPHGVRQHRLEYRRKLAG